jgi:hypothetical protein
MTVSILLQYNSTGSEIWQLLPNQLILAGYMLRYDRGRQVGKQKEENTQNGLPIRSQNNLQL